MKFEYDEKTGMGTITGFDEHYTEIQGWIGKKLDEHGPAFFDNMNTNSICQQWFNEVIKPRMDFLLFQAHIEKDTALTTPPAQTAPECAVKALVDPHMAYALAMQKIKRPGKHTISLFLEGILWTATLEDTNMAGHGATPEVALLTLIAKLITEDWNP